MTTIFYLFTLFAIYKELNWILYPKSNVENLKKFTELSNAHKGKKWDEYSPEFKSMCKDKFYSIFILIWLFIGLFTFQWIAFLFMLLLNIIIINPLSQLFKFNLAFYILHWINSVIGFVFGLFIVINHYHLHLDLWQIVKNWI